jgi:hypothetical protein
LEEIEGSSETCSPRAEKDNKVARGGPQRRSMVVVRAAVLRWLVRDGKRCSKFGSTRGNLRWRRFAAEGGDCDESEAAHWPAARLWPTAARRGRARRGAAAARARRRLGCGLKGDTGVRGHPGAARHRPQVGALRRHGPVGARDAPHRPTGERSS